MLVSIDRRLYRRKENVSNVKSKILKTSVNIILIFKIFNQDKPALLKFPEGKQTNLYHLILCFQNNISYSTCSISFSIFHFHL